MRLRARGNRIWAKAGVVFGSVGVDAGLAFNWRGSAGHWLQRVEKVWIPDVDGHRILAGISSPRSTVQIRHYSMYLILFGSRLPRVIYLLTETVIKFNFKYY